MPRQRRGVPKGTWRALATSPTRASSGGCRSRRLPPGWSPYAPPVAFELGYAARGSPRLPGPWLTASRRSRPFPQRTRDPRRALEVQSAPAARGQHRALSLVDELVAAAAARPGTLSCCTTDADFELVAGITGQAQEWVVPCGTAG